MKQKRITFSGSAAKQTVVEVPCKLSGWYMNDAPINVHVELQDGADATTGFTIPSTADGAGVGDSGDFDNAEFLTNVVAVPDSSCTGSFTITYEELER
jgi:hypothetical protein